MTKYQTFTKELEDQLMRVSVKNIVDRQSEIIIFASLLADILKNLLGLTSREILLLNDKIEKIQIKLQI